MKEFEVWKEGFMATGEHGHAQFLGKFQANTFEEAVEKALDHTGRDRSYFNKEQLTYWGCRFYDNEKQARRSFG